MKHHLPLASTLALLTLTQANSYSSSYSWCNQPAQSPAYYMHIDALTSVAGKDFQIAITRTPRFVRLRYARRDSVRTRQFKTDFPEFFHTGAPLPDPTAERERLRFFSRVLDRYTVFTQDSIQLSVGKHPAFVQLLDSVYTASDETLEQKQRNQRRYVLDGTLVTLLRATRKGAEAPQELGVRHPQPATHPLLYRLLHETLQVYRRNHQESFLTLEATSGY